MSNVIGSTHIKRLSTESPFCDDEGTSTTAGEIRGLLGLAEVKGKTVTLLRWLLNKVPETMSAGRVF
ncbi:hypothetical protein NSP_6670 [Nodularia spumigena CCY9414]|nr:hypothetical protein NSP_6670 [Nodularia spumigena CCY9414]